MNLAGARKEILAPVSSIEPETYPLSSPASATYLSQADGVSLKQAVRRTTRAETIQAFVVVVPLLAFIMVFFIVPLVDMLTRSAYDPLTARFLPKTMEELSSWDRSNLPGETVYAVIAEELVARREEGTLGKLALRLNHEIAGARTLIFNTATRLEREQFDSYKQALISIDETWAEREFWSTLEIVGRPLTLRYYLAAFDHRYDADGQIVPREEYQRVYVRLLIRTFWASAVIVVLCLLIGYPIAYQLATTPTRIGNLLLMMVLLPFWTALLVRTAAWIILLQQQGVINDLLVVSGILSDDSRPRMVYNMTGTIIAMTHIMLPFMILPLYSVMKGISSDHMRAAASLGANPVVAFRRVYLPQTMPGVGAGCILVFILSIGYYITPALVGGRSGIFISSLVAYHIQVSLNWGLGAALAAVILISVLILYLLYNRIFGVVKIGMG